ncbi:RND family efflux transporter MFP subunit [Inquilinus ginsengisoli]|uniref:RND family efflux transporter MFP subunit n=1 Tax=Inquilinus ginsengisoli TaxID=363840 RepID=A0ABU1JXD9_9PROT|nr:efflux RND transporter periplasmic adaptor subunit [Inquilinus ginsengisoli]MDR6292947.1 RND family efflux transporter MFP subunit [Inquilinus ginsengisoli]
MATMWSRTIGGPGGWTARLVLIGGLGAGLAACNEQNAYVPPPPPKVTVAQPVQQPVTAYLELTGSTEAFNAVDLEARVQGDLVAIDYQDGALVKQGTTLFRIQRDTYEAQLQQAKAELILQQAGQANAQSEYNRQASLGKNQFASEAHVEDAKTLLDQKTAAVMQAQANVDLATITLGYTEITAPFDGVVTAHLADVGALVGYGGPTKLASIVQTDPIHVTFTVSEQQVLQVKQGLAAQGRKVADLHAVPVEIGLQTETGYPHRGTIDYIAPQIDPRTGTLTVRGLFENKDLALLPGLFARVRVPVGPKQAGLLVDDTAIGTSQLGSYLLVLGKDDVVEQRRVTLGPADGALRVVRDGIGPDDWVVIGGIQKAIPGSKVAPDKAAMAGQAAGPSAAAKP